MHPKDSRPVRMESERSRARSLMKDDRFRAFLENALAGQELAVERLWSEYEIDFAKEGGRFE